MVTVVIPARNAAHHVEGQLRALSEQTYGGSWEIVLVDDGSTDETAEVARRSAADLGVGVRIVSIEPATGVSGARNAGVAASTGDLIAFCDSDDVAAPTWLAGLVYALRSADVVGGRLDVGVLNARRCVGWRAERESEWPPRTMDFLPYAVGANLGVRRAVVIQVGGFDESFRGSHDDVEFCWRAQLAGKTLVSADDAVMHYRLRDTWRGLAAQRFGYGRSYAQLQRLYEGRGVAPTSIPAESRRVLGLTLALCRKPSRERFGRWLYWTSWCFGRAVGVVEGRA